MPAMSNPTPPRGLLKEVEPLELPLPLEVVIAMFFDVVAEFRDERRSVSLCSVMKKHYTEHSELYK
jgi:hypothetical protein